VRDLPSYMFTGRERRGAELLDIDDDQRREGAG
jgi:hypothetical protein